MITFADGVAVGILLSCVVAWFGVNYCDCVVHKLECTISDLESRINEVQRDKHALMAENKRLLESNDSQRKEVTRLYGLRENMIYGLKELLGDQ